MANTKKAPEKKAPEKKTNTKKPRGRVITHPGASKTLPKSFYSPATGTAKSKKGVPDD